MKFTRATGYAVQALVVLARQEGGRGLAAEALAAAHGLPVDFLRKTFEALVAAGVLRSLRGRHGGYRLARPAAAITLLEVVEVTGGPIQGGAPDFDAPAAAAPLNARLGAIGADLADVVRGQLQAVTLADLAGEGSRGRATP